MGPMHSFLSAYNSERTQKDKRGKQTAIIIRPCFTFYNSLSSILSRPYVVVLTIRNIEFQASLSFRHILLVCYFYKAAWCTHIFEFSEAVDEVCVSVSGDRSIWKYSRAMHTLVYLCENINRTLTILAGDFPSHQSTCNFGQALFKFVLFWQVILYT